MKKKICLVVLLIVVVSILCSIGQAFCAGEDQNLKDIEEELKNNVDENLDRLDFGSLEEWLSQLGQQSGGLFDGGVAQTIKAVIAGEYQGGFGEFTTILLSAIGGSVADVLPLLITVIAIGILFSMLQGLTSGFLTNQTKEIIYFVCFGAMIVLIMVQVSSLVSMTVKTIGGMQRLMQIAFPILLTSITLLGGNGTSAAFRPMMSILTMSVTTLITKLILPIFIAIIVFCIVGNLTKKVKLDRLTKFLRSTANVVLGGAFGLFITFLTFQGLTGNLADSISVKTAKFAMQSYIPILGGYLSDGFDLVMASVVLVKNSFGFVVVLMLLSYLFLPVLKIVVFSLGLKLAGGIIEPIADERFGKMIYSVSKNLNLLAAAIAGVGFMFLITVMLCITVCNFGAV